MNGGILGSSKQIAHIGINSLPAPSLIQYRHKLSFNKNDEIVRESIRAILESLGEDPNREGLQQTPQRVAAMYRELLAGYAIAPHKIINGALFDAKGYHDMIVIEDIQFYSLCEHHLLPFYGNAHIAYIPEKKIVGLSKIPRIVEMFARRLQIQERITQQIADFLMEALDPRGVGVLLEGLHMCIMMRGVKKVSTTVTEAMRGVFQKDKQRAAFWSRIK